MTRLLFTFLLVVIFSSCEDVYKTQLKAPEITFDNGLDTLDADGVSNVKVTVKLDRLPGPGETLTIHTTNGHLVELPSSDYSNGEEMIQKPMESQEFSFRLVASKIPDSNVVVGIDLNEHYSERIFKFKRVCADELLTFIADPEVDISSGERGEVLFTLLNRGESSVSENTRINICMSTDSFATITSNVLYTSDTVSMSFVPTGNAGRLDFTANVRQPGCPSVDSDIFSIEFL